MIYSYSLILIASFFLVLLFIKNKNAFFYNSNHGIHNELTPKIGGFPIYLSFCCFCLMDKNLSLNYAFSFLPLFVLTLYSDFKDSALISWRLFLTLFCSWLFCFFFSPITNIDTPVLSALFNFKWFAIIFSILCISSVTHAFNLIDGLNGQVSFNFFFILLAIYYVDFSLLGSENSFYLIFLFTSAIIPFIFNFPFAKIFSGDSGAYFFGFYTATSIIMIFNNSNLISWGAILLICYPAFELFFTIGRRKISQVSIFKADKLHLHTLIYYLLDEKLNFNNKILLNSLASFCMIPIYLFGPISFVKCYDNLSCILILLIVFISLYLFIYFKVKSSLRAL